METILEQFDRIDWVAIASSVLRIGIWLVVLWIASRVARSLIRRFERRIVHTTRKENEPATEAEKRASTLAKLVEKGVYIGLCAVVGLGILREIGIDIGPVLASAGIVGLAVGFGAQNLVRDVISGFFLLLENQVRVGDVAVVNGTGGLVEEVNFRTIVLRDLSGGVHIFPNGTINTLSNMTREWSAYEMNIKVAYKEDIDRVLAVMRRVSDELQTDAAFGPNMLAPIELFGVDDFADSAVVIKARIKTKPIKQWEVGREYRKRLKAAFDREGIEIPFPHASLYFGEASRPFAVETVDRLPPAESRRDEANA